MNTHVLLDHEPVADGGFYARAVLLIEGTQPDRELAAREPERIPRSIEAVSRLAARNVQVDVRPGFDAEFFQMRHTFESEGWGNLLTIKVGDVYCLDRIRIRMEALVGPGAVESGEADVGTLVVVSEVSTRAGVELERVELPILLSTREGGRIRPAVSRWPLPAPILVRGKRGA